MSGSQSLVFEHERFGAIEAPESSVIHCQGLPGFPAARSLLILEHDRSSPFAWLVCFEIPDLALVVTDPSNFFSDYDPNPHLSDLRAIRATPEDEIDVLVIANVGDQGAFLNLAAPLLVNPKSGQAIQAILADSVNSIRAPIGAPPERRAGDSAQIESKPHR